MRWRALPTDRHVRVTNATLAAPQGALQARAAQSSECLGLKVNRVTAAATSYSRDLAALGMHGVGGWQCWRGACIQYCGGRSTVCTVITQIYRRVDREAEQLDNAISLFLEKRSY